MSNANQLQIDRREKTALALAPSLRDKFDFSHPEQYETWADYAFLAADAFIKKADALLMAAKAKDDSASLAAKHEQEMSRMVRKTPPPIGVEVPLPPEEEGKK